MLNENLQTTQTRQSQSAFDLKSMGEAALLDLRNQIDKALPTTSLKDMDLAKEMVVQYRAVKRLQDDILNDDSVPANQRAQVVNACANALETLVEMQTKHHTSERLKQIETILIDVINGQSESVQTAFFDEYRSRLEKV